MIHSISQSTETMLDKYTIRLFRTLKFVEYDCKQISNGVGIKNGDYLRRLLKQEFKIRTER
jgi:hypothetical protein